MSRPGPVAGERDGVIGSRPGKRDSNSLSVDGHYSGFRAQVYPETKPTTKPKVPFGSVKTSWPPVAGWLVPFRLIDQGSRSGVRAV